MVTSQQQKIKIVVTGGRGTGKSTFIHALSDPWTDEPGREPPIRDFGRIYVDDLGIPLTIFLFGTQQGQQPAYLRDIIDQFLCIVIVNSADPQTFDEARATINVVEHYSDFVYVVAASFQDHDDAWNVDDLRIALKVPETVPIIPCVSWHFESVTAVLRALLELIVQQH